MYGVSHISIVGLRGQTPRAMRISMVQKDMVIVSSLTMYKLSLLAIATVFWMFQFSRLCCDKD
jgi:hypothetical protein